MTLTLTADELALFQALPEEVKKGWKTEEETLKFEDTPEKMQLRISLMRISDPILTSAQMRLLEAKDSDEATEIFLTTSFAHLSVNDLTEIFFALGPVTLSSIIRELLKRAKTDDEVQDIEAIATIRHSLLSSLS